MEPDSSLHPSQPGNAFQPVIKGDPDVVVTKEVNSAFLGTPRLEPWLRDRGIQEIVVAGIQTNMCCETTARMAATSASTSPSCSTRRTPSICPIPSTVAGSTRTRSRA
jgi:nicotinamidase-related amidase